jgi:hypothetical protein
MPRGARWKALLETRRASEEQRIAKAVADLVAPGEAVGLTRRGDHPRGGAGPGRAGIWRPGRPR